MQRRVISLIEASINTLSGYFLSVGIGVILYPIYGVEFSVRQLSEITAIFTITSIMRGYFVRRTFNWFHCREKRTW